MPRYRIVEYQMLASANVSFYDHMMMVKKAMTQRHLELKFRQSVQVMHGRRFCLLHFINFDDSDSISIRETSFSHSIVTICYWYVYEIWKSKKQYLTF